MNYRSQQRTAKRVMILLGLGLVTYILLPPLYWHLSDFISSTIHSSSSSYCPPCFCDCSSQPLLSLSDVVSRSGSTDCMKKDPEVSEEMEKSLTELLAVKEAEAARNQQLANVALLEAKKMASQYQKEADKCSAGMDTCEVDRERADEALIAQRHVSTLWELRAHQRGWRPSAESTDLDYAH
ncbi:hypothetical protein LINPERHAP1_LOCUS26159 [Linum perenne]